MQKQIYIFDTTLRDGEQTPGAKLNTIEKVEIAKQLEYLGVDVIEFGVKNDTIHAINERTTVDEVQGLYKVFKELISSWK